MTRGELINNWDCVVAFKEGKTIQFRTKNQSNLRWIDGENLGFQKEYEYRIKPKPKTYYILWTMSGAVWKPCTTWDTRKLAEEEQRKYYSEVPTKITEVLEPIDD